MKYTFSPLYFNVYFYMWVIDELFLKKQYFSGSIRSTIWGGVGSFFLKKLSVSEYKIDVLNGFKNHKFTISFWGTFLFNVGCNQDN